jgi:hypothetical protein
MKKQKIILAVVICVLIATGVMMYQKYKQVAPPSSPTPSDSDQANEVQLGKDLAAKYRAEICSQNAFPADINPSFIAPTLTKDAYDLLEENFFCQDVQSEGGTTGNCALLPDQARRDECNNGVYLFAPLLEYLSGNKEKAKAVCANLSSIPVCQYMDNLDSFKNGDACSKLSPGSQAACSAFFTGDPSYCQKYTDQKKQNDCVVSSKFMKVVASGNISSCDSLSVPGEVDFLPVACKLDLEKTSQVCENIYDSFKKNYCSGQ